MNTLEKALWDVRDGRSTFQEFIIATRVEFRRLGDFLFRHWAPPWWFSADDIEQELYLGAWNHIWRFDPDHGKKVTFRRYIVFNAMAYAKLRLHKARGVSLDGTPDKKKSNIEALSTSDIHEEFFENLLRDHSPAAEELLVENEERLEKLTIVLDACETPKEQTIVKAVRQAGSIGAAWQVLYDDPDTRIQLRLNSESHTQRLIFHHARAVARRVQEVRN